MIFQVKKLFLSLIFTVALCCGLSVSASAVVTVDITSLLVNARITPWYSDGDVVYEYIFPATNRITAGYSTLGTSFSVVPGERISVSYSSAYSNVQWALQLLYSDGVEAVFNQENSVPRYDTNWLSLTDIVTVPDDCVCLWFTSRCSDNADMSLSDIYSVKLNFLDRAQPELTSRTYSFTDTTAISQITLVNLDPLETYKVYWSVYDANDNLLNHGYSEQIGDITGVESVTAFCRIINLQPATTYRLSWNLYTDDEILPTNSINTVTTLGSSSSGGSEGNPGEDETTGAGDGNSGILLLILNKVSAILDTMNGGQPEGILASINEKLDALIDTLANPEEQELEDNFKESLTGVNDNFFGDSAKGQAVTVSDVGNLADTQSTVKNIFQSDYTVTDFFNLFSDTSLFAWFSAETALDLNPNAYGGAALADMDDPYNMQSYYENLEKVRGKK